MSRSILEAASKQAANFKKFGKQARAELSQDEQAAICTDYLLKHEEVVDLTFRNEKLASQVEAFRTEINKLNGRIGGLTKKLNAAK